METSYAGRVFQLWQYKVSHGSLLIRSPKTPTNDSNIDLICVDVEYLSTPRYLHGLEIASATPDELKALSGIVGWDVPSSGARVLISEGRRYPIVAASFRISTNQEDIFYSPFD